MSLELRRLPIIYMWDRIVVPMQGEISDELADRLSDDVLAAIHKSRARGLVIDLTGVWLVDSHLCAMISNVAAAAGLMGARTVISGLSPEIAMTLQTMGVEFNSVMTALTLEHALTMLGLQVRDLEREEEEDIEPWMDHLPEATEPEPFPGSPLREEDKVDFRPHRK